jgi:hypothetical protein
MGIDEDAGIREALEQGLGHGSSQQHRSKERELNMDRGGARTNNQVYWWKRKWESGLATVSDTEQPQLFHQVYWLAVCDKLLSVIQNNHNHVL